ncbi:hypothetical protein [Streptomyces minutiscleroticus]|uniref:Uncharacterized protein n=1 Tax=Streptomyces minutiscleroticus TaxID=68238 RepID=A0A918NK15_9ACTN|nr:hypothetical protein [Streptomyces minutiscleroticus]GGX73895.1 hypothetical protein GCM10010358_30330 [Streptomyces minutiscleroticus]
MRLAEDAHDSDVGALKKWLERESGLEELARRGELQIHERAAADERGTPMGAGMEIVLLLTGWAANRLFDAVLDQTVRAVTAWRANRRSVESGEPPEAEVAPGDDER